MVAEAQGPAPEKAGSDVAGGAPVPEGKPAEKVKKARTAKKEPAAAPAVATTGEKQMSKRLKKDRKLSAADERHLATLQEQARLAAQELRRQTARVVNRASKHYGVAAEPPAKAPIRRTGATAVSLQPAAIIRPCMQKN